MFKDFSFDDFWEDSDYARREYVEAAVTSEGIEAVEAALGFRLPAAYVALMRTQNGGIPTRTCFPTTVPTSWAEDHVAISGFMGIGSTKRYALLGEIGSQFMQQAWGYPDFGICIGNCPSAGHDMIMLDYRECGPEGEPSVVHVDQEADYDVTVLAPDFETFVRGLVGEEVFDTAVEDLEAVLTTIRDGAFSTELTALLAASESPPEVEAALRELLRSIATEKGYFAFHADIESVLVYDVLFDLYRTQHVVSSAEAYLEAFPNLLVFGDGDIATNSYAPQLLEDWMEARLSAGEIETRAGHLVFSEAYQRGVRARLLAFLPPLG